MESFGSQLCQVPVQTNQKRGYSSLSGSPQGNGGTLWFPVPNTLGWVNDAQSGHLLGGRDTVASVSLQSWYHRNLARALGRLTGTSLGVQQLDPTLPQQGEGIRSLVGELRSHWPHGVAKKKKKGLGWLRCAMHLPHPWILCWCRRFGSGRWCLQEACPWVLFYWRRKYDIFCTSELILLCEFCKQAGKSFGLWLPHI